MPYYTEPADITIVNVQKTRKSSRRLGILSSPLMPLFGAIFGLSIAAIAAPTLVTIIETEDFQKTADGFEQWSIQHPTEFSALVDKPVDFKEVAYMVNGEHSFNAIPVNVQYIEKDNDSYTLCFIPVEDGNTYAYYSESRKITKSEDSCQ